MKDSLLIHFKNNKSILTFDEQWNEMLEFHSSFEEVESAENLFSILPSKIKVNHISLIILFYNINYILN
jgi:hypothetical protein